MCPCRCGRSLRRWPSSGWWTSRRRGRAVFFAGGWQRLEDAYLSPDELFHRLGLGGDLQDFSPRPTLIAEIDSRLADPTVHSGWIVLEAEAGLGKTAVLAYLARIRHWAHHFAQRTNQDTTDRVLGAAEPGGAADPVLRAAAALPSRRWFARRGGPDRLVLPFADRSGTAQVRRGYHRPARDSGRRVGRGSTGGRRCAVHPARVARASPGRGVHRRGPPRRGGHRDSPTGGVPVDQDPGLRRSQRRRSAAPGGQDRPGGWR